MVTIAEEDFRP